MDVDSNFSSSAKRSSLPDYEEENDEDMYRAKRKRNNDSEEINIQGSSTINGYEIRRGRSSTSKSQIPDNDKKNDFIIYRASSTSSLSKPSSETLNKNFKSSKSYSSEKTLHGNLKNDRSNKEKSLKRNFDDLKNFSYAKTNCKSSGKKNSKEELTKYAKEHKLTMEVQYIAKLKIGSHSFTTGPSSYSDPREAEEEVCKRALQALSAQQKNLSKKNQTFLMGSSSKYQPSNSMEASSEPMQLSTVSHTISSNHVFGLDQFIDELKNLLAKQDMHILFRSEVPSEYKKMFGKLIHEKWFDIIEQHPHTFKIEPNGPLMTTISLR